MILIVAIGAPVGFLLAAVVQLFTGDDQGL
jgi:hypothetical protein